MSKEQDGDQKHFRLCSSSDTSNDSDLDYLNVDTGRVAQATSTTQSVDGAIMLSKTPYDALIEKLNALGEKIS